MSPSTAAKTPLHAAGAGVFFGDVLANRRLHLGHKVATERIAGIRDL
ncbi:hypothetical protein [Mycobacterium sp. Lab-001]